MIIKHYLDMGIAGEVECEISYTYKSGVVTVENVFYLGTDITDLIGDNIYDQDDLMDEIETSQYAESIDWKIQDMKEAA